MLVRVDVEWESSGVAPRRSRTTATRVRATRPVAFSSVAMSAVVATVLTLTGCASGGSAEGTLTGHLLGVGGPAGNGPSPWPGTLTITAGGVEHVVSVGDDGSYSVTLAPGSYTVVGRSPMFQDGTSDCRPSGDAHITAGATTSLDVACQMM